MKSKKTSITKSPKNEELSKKLFRESLQTENFYQTILDYDLREEAYKAAIRTYVSLKANSH